ncbi:hypothetical protein L7F22_003529 [Adiantum nelumboides]|nr:hypothetical protein [Adiantum nelumboides]
MMVGAGGADAWSPAAESESGCTVVHREAGYGWLSARQKQQEGDTHRCEIAQGAIVWGNSISSVKKPSCNGDGNGVSVLALLHRQANGEVKIPDIHSVQSGCLGVLQMHEEFSLASKIVGQAASPGSPLLTTFQRAS